MKFIVSCILAFGLWGCAKKPGMNSSDVEYVKLSLDLMRTRTAVDTTLDSSARLAKFAKVFTKHQTSKADYLKASEGLASEPARATAVYNALRDSLGVKEF